MSEHRGGCHCGAVQVTFDSARAPAETQVRACQCTFCRAHGGLTVSDPQGSVRIEARRDALVRYRFGLKTADFLICGRCGVYLGATCEVDGRRYAVININALADRAAFTMPVAPVVYDGENAVERVARRKQRWTPVTQFVA